MEITKEKRENYTVLKINSKKLDSTLSPNLKAEFVTLNKQGESNFLLDLSDVRYCDSSGLSALLVGNRLCNDIDGKFVMCSMQEMVKKLIEISQLDKILNITENLNEAEELMA
jgi:anti-anti-sigma factor